MNKDLLREFYLKVCGLFGLEVLNDDFLNVFSISPNGEKTYVPFKVANLGVIFPTDTVLKEGKWSDRVCFHPLSESSIRDISPVMAATMNAMRLKYYQNIFFLVCNFATLAKATRDGTVKHVSPELTKALAGLPKTIDDKTIKFICDVFTADNTKDRSIVKVFAKKNGKIADVEYKRVCTTYFPIHEQLTEAVERKEGTFWDISAARKSDLQVLLYILNQVIPDADDNDRYAYGTMSGTAPYFDAIFRSAVKVQEVLNNFMSILGTHLPDEVRSAIYADTDYFDEVTELKKYRNVISPMKYNEGEVSDEDELDRTPSGGMPDLGRRAQETVEKSAGWGARREATDSRDRRDSDRNDDDRRRDRDGDDRDRNRRRDRDDEDRGRRTSRDRNGRRYDDDYDDRDEDDYETSSGWGSRMERDRDRGRGRGRDRGRRDDDRGRGRGRRR